MRNLIVSVPSLPPYITIENNEIVGILSAAYRYRLYFILDKMNYTLVTKNVSTPSHCSSGSVCSGYLRQLQLGEIDLAGTFSSLQISTSAINLTIGPPVIEEQCSIIYSPTIKMDKSVHAIDSVIASFSKSFWFLVLLFILLFAFTQTLLNLNNKIVATSYLNLLFTKFIETLYSLFQQLAKQNFPTSQSTIKRLCLLCFVLYSLLIHLIFSAAMQNAIYVSSTFDQLDTLDDVAASGHSISLIVGQCSEAIQASQGSISSLHGITSSVHNLIGVDNFNLAAFFAQENRVIITEKYNVIHAQILVYKQTINGTKGRRMYASAEPVFNLLQFPILSSFLEPGITKQLIKNIYSSFETGNYENNRGYLYDMIAISDGTLCSECLKPLRKIREVITTSIPFNQAGLVFAQLGIAFGISFIVFTTELLFKLCTEINH